MRHKKTRAKSKPEEFEFICKTGDQLIVKFGMNVRYVEKVFKSAHGWTKQSSWERCVDGIWQEIKWTEFDNHST